MSGVRCVCCLVSVAALSGCLWLDFRGPDREKIEMAAGKASVTAPVSAEVDLAAIELDEEFIGTISGAEDTIQSEDAGGKCSQRQLPIVGEGTLALPEMPFALE